MRFPQLYMKSIIQRNIKIVQIRKKYNTKKIIILIYLSFDIYKQNAYASLEGVIN